METIENAHLKVCANYHGAELCSIIRKSDNREFLWQADPAYWKRHSPVLFPIVGSLWNNEMCQDGNKYVMTQHGFARDMEFILTHKTDNEMMFLLHDNEYTLKKYPYNFELEIGYKLQDNIIKVIWQVRNTSETEMHFQIGAHPAFNYMDYAPDADIQGYMKFDTSADTYKLSVIGEKGCLHTSSDVLNAPEGVIEINRHTFDNDALILESKQVNSVTLFDRNKAPYLHVSFNTPVVGLWSPARGQYAPFLCIEPWYGRCDRERFNGNFESKDWMQHLAPGKQFYGEYLIEIL